MAKSDQSITRSAREIILGDGISTLVFMVVNSVWNELAAMLAVALGMKMRTTGLMVLITGLMLYCPFSDAVFGAGAVPGPLNSAPFFAWVPSYADDKFHSEGTSFNPLNNAAFAAAGRGPVALHLGRMVCPGPLLGFITRRTHPLMIWPGRVLLFLLLISHLSC